jgi:GT2 family glycosyltransferase
VNYFEYVDNFKKNNRYESILMVGEGNRPKRKYTVAIPTYNRENLVKESIISAFNQEGIHDYEILIVDNGESGKTLDFVKSLDCDNIYYYKNKENIGMFGNWNRCIELAKGEFITILNDDDILSKNYLKTCERYLNANTEGLFFKNYRIYETDFKEDKFIVKKRNLKRVLKMLANKKKKLTLFDFFLRNRSAGTLGVLLKAENLKMLGGYNPDYFPSSDYVLHANYCYNYNAYSINEKLNYYRIAENESANQETLKRWEYIDNEIRKYLINIIGKNKKSLLLLNSIIQENRIRGMIENWNYQTDTKINQRIQHVIIDKITGLRIFLNI